MKKRLSKIANPGEDKLKSLLRFLSFLFTKPGLGLLARMIRRPFRKKKTDYNKWIKAHTDPVLLKKEYETQIGIGNLKNKPRFSIVISVTNSTIKLLPATVDTVLAQLYLDWELCIATVSSANEQVRNLLDSYSKKDPRIKTTVDIHFGAQSAIDAAAGMATGEYVLLMEPGDLQTINCLFEFVKYINAHPLDELIYADSDTVDEHGAFSAPMFKPDWSPDSLLCRNYIGAPVVIKKGLLTQVDNQSGLLQDSYSLLLYLTELTKRPVGHIRNMLYHSCADKLQLKHNLAKWAPIAAMRRRNTPLVKAARRNWDTSARVVKIQGVAGGYTVTGKIAAAGKVSMLMPTKDNAVLLKTAIDSILQKTDYPDYEIIVLNNNSTSAAFFALMDEYKEKHPTLFRCIDAAFPFNFSKLMNLGVSESTGQYILMLNNDVEVIDNNWLTTMVAYAQQPHIGAVGVKLLYPDGTIQHAGIVLGAGETITSHIFANEPGTWGPHHEQIQTVNNYSALTAACLMCRKEVFNKAGGMDEQLPVEYNDVDFCLKLLQQNYYNVYLPMVQLYHYESATRGHPFRSKKAWEQHAKDLAVFKSKWPGYVGYDPFYNGLNQHFQD